MGDFPEGHLGWGNLDSHYKWLTRHCEWPGKAQSSGFCSICDTTNEDNELRRGPWNQSVAIEVHIADVQRWHKRVCSMKQFMIHFQNLKSLKSPYHLKRELKSPYDDNGNRVLCVEISFLGTHFGPSLQCLNIPFAYLDDDALEIISFTAPNLTHLNVRQSNSFASTPQITEKGYLTLNALTKLEHLDLSIEEYESACWTDLTSSVLTRLTELKRLKVLVACGCMFQASENNPLAFVSNFPRLETLVLTYSLGLQDHKQIFEPLHSVPHLRWLDIRATGITEKSLYTITRLPLSYLFLQDIDDISKGFIQDIIAMKHMKGISLYMCGRYYYKEVEALFNEFNRNKKEPIELYAVRTVILARIGQIALLLVCSADQTAKFLDSLHLPSHVKPKQPTTPSV